MCRIKHYMLVLFNYQDFTFRQNHLRAIFLSIIYDQQYLLLDNFSHLSLLLWHKSNGRLIWTIKCNKTAIKNRANSFTICSFSKQIKLTQFLTFIYTHKRPRIETIKFHIYTSKPFTNHQLYHKKSSLLVICKIVPSD